MLICEGLDRRAGQRLHKRAV